PRAPDAIASLAAAIGCDPAEIEARILTLGGDPPGLGAAGADHSKLDEALDAMLQRPELAFNPQPPTRAELAQLVARAWTPAPQAADRWGACLAQRRAPAAPAPGARSAPARRWSSTPAAPASPRSTSARCPNWRQSGRCSSSTRAGPATRAGRPTPRHTSSRT